MKVVVVAGGAGFIGYHLCKRLLDEGNRVIVFDNLITGREENITALQNSFFTFYNVDICNTEDIKAKFSMLSSVDEIYNLTGIASPADYYEKPFETFQVSVYGTQNLLSLADLYNAKFLQASTSEIYGDPTIPFQHEKYFGNVNCFGPRSCYDEGKRAAETLCYMYNQQGVDCKVARIFNTYGPAMRLDDGRIVTEAIKAALTNSRLTIYNNGYQTRSFCYVDDTVDGLINLMASNENTPVNIGSDYEITIMKLVEIVEKLTQTKINIQYEKARQDDPIQRRPDLLKAQRVFQYNPQTLLEEGLLKTIEYFKGIK